MFNLPSIRIGRVFGIPLEVNPTWLIVFTLVVVTLAISYFPAEQGLFLNLISAIITALLFFASIVIHELSHSLVARAGGIKIDKVTLFIFGGVAQMEEEPRSPGREFVMAIAGPGASLILSALFFGLLVILEARNAPAVFVAPVLYLSVINLYVAIFNLLPGFPLDGGRVVRAGLWAITGDILKATRWASRAGQLIGFSMIALAVLGVLRGTLDFIWFGLIGWFIATLADSAYRQQVVKTTLHQITVGALMTPSPTVAPGDITLEELAHEYLLGGRHSRYPVSHAGEIVGLISLARAKELPRAEWARTSVADIADRDLSQLLVDVDAPADSVLERLAQDSPGALLVVGDGRLVGIVTRADAIAHIQRARSEQT